MDTRKIIQLSAFAVLIATLAACTGENTPQKTSKTKSLDFKTNNPSSDGRHHMIPGTGAPITGTPPVALLPGAGTPGAGAPGAGAPGAGTPGAGAPGAGAPGTGTPGTGTPGTGAPGTGTPGTGTPITPAVLPPFQFLPVLSDSDGNPNDAFATYNLTVDGNVPVNVATPSGNWTTPMMRYNNSQLPPVIVAKRGTQMTLNVQNNLLEDTTVHWHGFKIPAVQDGGPDKPIPVATSKTYNFQLLQSAASLWFHPHLHTATQVYNGLAGGFVVTDDVSINLETNKQIPSGAFDIPILVQDRSFTADTGTGVRDLVYQNNTMTGMLGDVVLVNGVQMPALEVETRQYRFRLYNGSNARTYDFALSNGASFKIVGTDGGLLAQPVDDTHVLLSAGERAEIVIDFSVYAVGDNITFISRPFASAGPAASALPNGAAFDVMRFDVATPAVDDVILYTDLPPNADIYDRLTELQATTTRDFVMSMGGGGPGGMRFLINGKSFDINRVDELVAAGTTEIWNVSNVSMMEHPFHAHAIQWQVLDRNNLPPVGSDLGWKDTVLVKPGESIRIIGRFDPLVNIGKYMYHCHILEHEESGMMGIFEIL